MSRYSSCLQVAGTSHRMRRRELPSLAETLGPGPWPHPKRGHVSTSLFRKEKSNFVFYFKSCILFYFQLENFPE
jgi:hypothetical protein